MRNQSYLKRILVCVISLAMYGFGNFLGVKAGSAGTNAWSTLALGIADLFGTSYGTGTLMISVVIIIIDIIGKGKIGIGSVLNALLVPFFAEVFLTLTQTIPNATNPVLGALLSLAGQAAISFATIFYMLPALGAGPRDTLMLIVGNKLPRFPIGIVKFVVEAMVLVVGVLLGAPFGLGTVLVIVLQASMFQMACRIMKYEPRSVVHEDLMDTWRSLVRK